MPQICCCDTGICIYPLQVYTFVLYWDMHMSFIGICICPLLGYVYILLEDIFISLEGINISPACREMLVS